MSTLPKNLLDRPTFSLTLPSTKQKVRFRSFTVREEKLLLVALESKEAEEMLEAVLQVVQNCLVSPQIDVRKLPVFDVEYLFLKFRAKSVSNVQELSFRDKEDGQVRDFEVDLDQIEVDFPEDHTSRIMLSDKVGVVMRYPSIEEAATIDTLDGENLDDQVRLATLCVDSIFTEDDVWKVSDLSKEEVEDFVLGMSDDQFTRLRHFFVTYPSISHEIRYVNTKGTERKITLRGLSDFFPFA